MTRATTTHTMTPRRTHPAVLRAALRSHNCNDTESGRVAAQQRGTHRPTPCGYNRLIEVHDAANAIIATYRYDPFGRRLSKTLNTTASTGSAQAPAGSSTYYFYSAEGLIAEADANGQIIQSYGYAPGSTFTTNPLWTKLTTAGTATYYTYQNDHLGTPQKLLNQSGLTVWSATYDAFGRATVDPASTISNNLRFPGQYADQETGLHYNWMRFYDPGTGRYVTSDPIGLLGGVNLYTYVRGNPVRRFDPLGLWSTGAHEEIINAWAMNNGLSDATFQSIMKMGSSDADAFKFQGKEYSYMHAMSSSALSPKESCEEYKRFVTDHINRYRALMIEADRLGEGLNKDNTLLGAMQYQKRRAAYYQLGFALHAVMDNNSPAHTGFHKWETTGHEINRHGNFPGSLEDSGDITEEVKIQTVNDMNAARDGIINVDCSKLCNQR